MLRNYMLAAVLWSSLTLAAMVFAQDQPEIIAGSKGFTMKSSDGDFQLRIRTHLQVDGRLYSSDNNDARANSFIIRRNRIFLQSTLYKYLDFKVMPDFGQGRTELFDAYFDIRFAPSVIVRFGKTKVPFGLELLQSPLDFLFIERSLVNNLVPNRDIGVQLYGELAKGAVGYQVSVSNGVTDLARGDTDESDSKDITARLTFDSFRPGTIAALKGLSAGIAITTGNRAGTNAAPNLPNYRSPGQVTVFRYLSDSTAAGTAVASGSNIRVSPQSYYHWGPFGLLGEYVRSSHEVAIGTSLTKLEHAAWQVAGSFLLTGDNASFKTVEPKQIFDPEAGTWGAFEITARISQLISMTTRSPS